MLIFPAASMAAGATPGLPERQPVSACRTTCRRTRRTSTTKRSTAQKDYGHDEQRAHGIAFGAAEHNFDKDWSGKRGEVAREKRARRRAP
jgi:hypothetical protein